VVVIQVLAQEALELAVLRGDAIAVADQRTGLRADGVDIRRFAAARRAAVASVRSVASVLMMRRIVS